jgi:hypothetical protein
MKVEPIILRDKTVFTPEKDDVIDTYYGFSDVTQKPKNTMITITRGDVVYFGIARCKEEADQFIKKEGRGRALMRALFAIEEKKSPDLAGRENFLEGEYYLYGWVTTGDVNNLLEVFEHIDTRSHEEMWRFYHTAERMCDTLPTCGNTAG